MTTGRSLIAGTMVGVLLLALGTSPLGAQQGHPLEGTWQGFWGMNAGDRNFLTLILRWNGENVVGGVNPGPNAGRVIAMELDSSTWTVRFDLEVPDRVSGDVVRVTGEGRLFDIGSPRRSFRGLLDERPDSHFSVSRQ